MVDFKATGVEAAIVQSPHRTAVGVPSATEELIPRNQRSTVVADCWTWYAARTRQELRRFFERFEILPVDRFEQPYQFLQLQVFIVESQTLVLATKLARLARVVNSTLHILLCIPYPPKKLTNPSLYAPGLSMGGGDGH